MWSGVNRIGRADEEELVKSAPVSSQSALLNSASTSTGGRVAATTFFLDDSQSLAGVGEALQNDCDDCQDSVTACTAPATAKAKHATSSSQVGGCRPHVHVCGMTNDSLQHCYEALELIDPAKKERWEQARERCSPRVLEHECCPCYFLAVSQSNPWDAAQHLCRYWDERVNLFEERAFQALTSGYGGEDPTGLSKEDVEILETGFVQLLPSDAEGRSIYYGEHSRLLPHMYPNTKGRLRVTWYVFHKAFSSGEAQAHRLVSVVLMGPHVSASDWPYASACMNLYQVLPIQPDSIHLLALPSKTGTGRMAQAVLSFAVNVIGSFFQHLVKVHNGDKAITTGKRKSKVVDPSRRLLQQLRLHGFSKKGLPECAGGNFTHESFCAWIRRHRRLEHQLFWSEEKRVKRKRDLNRLHSQRKRLRRHDEFRELRKLVQELTQANERAREVQTELQFLLNKASTLATHLERKDPPPFVYRNAYLVPNTLSRPHGPRVQDFLDSKDDLKMPAASCQLPMPTPLRTHYRGCNFAKESDPLYGFVGHCISTSSAPLPPGELVERPSTTLNVTFSGNSAVSLMFNSDDRGPQQYSRSSCIVEARYLPPDGTNTFSLASSSGQLPASLERAPHDFHSLDLHASYTSSSEAYQRRIMYDAMTSAPRASGRPSAQPLLPTPFEPKPAPPLPPSSSAPLTVLGLVGSDRRENGDDDASSNGTLFDGILDEWDAAM